MTNFTPVKPRRSLPLISLALFPLVYFLHTVSHRPHNTSTTPHLRISFDAPLSLEDTPTVFTTSSTDTCLKHVLYDKPVKTGSTAVMKAIRAYLRARGRYDTPCNAMGELSCMRRAWSVCNSSLSRMELFSIIGHFQYASRALVECLRPDYYIVTSVRQPYDRRKSAYLWNRTLNGTHFSIPHTASFAEFMNRLPRCQLYHYYDGRGMGCDVGVTLKERIQDIVDRVDEVIDVYDQPVGPLHKLIMPYLARENESIRLHEDDFLEDFDLDTLGEEQMLYERLREKRLSAPDMSRLPC